MAAYILLFLPFLGALAEVQITVSPSVTIGRDELGVACQFNTSDTAITDVNSIQMYSNASGLLGSEDSKIVSIVYDRSSNAGLISWQHSGIEGRANVSGNVDSPSSSLLHLHVPASNVLCEDGVTHRCEFSVTRSGSPLIQHRDATITVLEGPNEVSFSRFSSKPELFSNASLSIYPANTTVTLTCNATVGSIPEPMQLCYLNGFENSTGYVPFNISSITDSGVMASGACNNRRLLSFDYHLETNDSATFLCMVGGNGTCVDGLLEETYTIRSESGDLYITTEPGIENQTLTTPDYVMENQTLITTEPVLGNQSLTTTKPGIENQTFTTTEPGIENQTLTTSEPSVENQTLTTSEPSVENQTLTTTETNVENQTFVTTTEHGMENQTLTTTEPSTENQTLTTTEAGIENQTLTTTEPSIENQTLTTTEPSIENQTLTATEPGIENQTFVTTTEHNIGNHTFSTTTETGNENQSTSWTNDTTFATAESSTDVNHTNWTVSVVTEPNSSFGMTTDSNFSGETTKATTHALSTSHASASASASTVDGGEGGSTTISLEPHSTTTLPVTTATAASVNFTAEASSDAVPTSSTSSVSSPLPSSSVSDSSSTTLSTAGVSDSPGPTLAPTTGAQVTFTPGANPTTPSSASKQFKFSVVCFAAITLMNLLLRKN
ncbi:mucin-22 isoform X1 [Magallana gigas]|uniref:mucin-22 isoform X1 n=1 Tax=Magallana gigas TaxID=29159 RepID=UPI00333EADEF